MVTDKKGEAAAVQIAHWAGQVAKPLDEQIEVDVYHDAESRTYVLRLMKGARVLLFRLSEAQVRTNGREAECERTLQRKIKDVWSLI